MYEAAPYQLVPPPAEGAVKLIVVPSISWHTCGCVFVFRFVGRIKSMLCIRCRRSGMPVLSLIAGTCLEGLGTCRAVDQVSLI